MPVPDTTSAVAAARPVAAGDRCIVAAGASISPSAVSLPRGMAFSLVPGAPGAPLQLVVSLPERQSASEGVCNAIFHAHTSPRQVAGGALSEDAIKCTLKPVDPRDYGALLSDAQLAQLRAIFPSGVCNYAKPAVGDVAHSVLWPSIGAERLQPLHALLWTVGRSSPSHR